MKLNINASDPVGTRLVYQLSEQLARSKRWEEAWEDAERPHYNLYLVSLDNLFAPGQGASLSIVITRWRILSPFGPKAADGNNKIAVEEFLTGRVVAIGRDRIESAANDILASLDNADREAEPIDPEELSLLGPVPQTTRN